LICVSNLTALDATPEEFIDGAAAGGFEGCGLRILPPKHAPDQYPIAVNPQWTRELRKRADDRGIRIWEAESFGIDRDTDVDELRFALEAAAVLGAKWIVSGGIDDDESRLVANYAKLAEAAHCFGLGMAIEFMPSRPMRSLADALRVHAKVDHSNAKLLIDALHLERSGGTPEDVSRIDPAKLAYVQACDAAQALPPPTLQALIEESRSGRLYPGEGILPLTRLYDVLPADIPTSLEAPHARHAHLPPAERLKLAGAATVRFVAAMRARHAIPASATGRAA
jgi:sugar phosphate isomerase/epimerase